MKVDSQTASEQTGPVNVTTLATEPAKILGFARMLGRFPINRCPFHLARMPALTAVPGIGSSVIKSDENIGSTSATGDGTPRRIADVRSRCPGNGCTGKPGTAPGLVPRNPYYSPSGCLHPPDKLIAISNIHARKNVERHTSLSHAPVAMSAVLCVGIELIR